MISSPWLSANSQSLLLILVTLDVPPPILMIEVPADGLADAHLEVFFGQPIQVALDFIGINGIAKVMTGAILHMGNQTLH